MSAGSCVSSETLTDQLCSVFPELGMDSVDIRDEFGDGVIRLLPAGLLLIKAVCDTGRDEDVDKQSSAKLQPSIPRKHALDMGMIKRLTQVYKPDLAI